ncbi:hypothetical protein RQM59_04590 [Flavobacteriaceae bacterium S356]|uniref:DUF3857 domain-containing protein n=1 Tax=Asprobacillus argus TaxID=3076534 RepID=A0ABU3LD46_9FLAO|nr:hypothetical protein [Flavobacteriaceae bacterium S356]
MKKITLIFTLITSMVTAQKFEISNMNEVTMEELQMTHYEKDSSAYAVILEERGHVYFRTKSGPDYRKELYIRMKILSNFTKDLGTIELYIIHSPGLDRQPDVEGITYNLEGGQIVKSFLSNSDIQIRKHTKYMDIMTLSLPNVRVGSVIEYKISSMASSYGIYDWDFQSHLPKVKSSYTAKLPLKPKYNIKQIGTLKPTTQSSELVKNCVGIEKCIEIKQEMHAIPAFIEEDYMLSKRNYVSGLQFEYDYFDRFVKKGKDHNWKSADQLVKDLFVFKLDEAKLIKSRIPKDIFSENNALVKANRIYDFVKDYFTWNGNTRLFKGRTTKKAISEKRGSLADINLTLYNALKAVDFKPKVVLLSNREERKLNKLFPAISEFNYLIVLLKIDGKDYFLDASDKLLPFGLVPFDCLNGEARIFDFDAKEFYWKQVKATLATSVKSSISCTLNDDETLTGKLSITRKGYEALESREVLSQIREDQYLEDFESENVDFEISSYKNVNEKNLDKPLKEIYEFDLDTEASSSKTILINPFIYGRLTKNPFKLEDRQYAVDYGYKRKYITTISIKVPDTYTIKKTPQKQAIYMPNKSASLIVNSYLQGNTINIYLKISINKITFYKEEYLYLKEFYNAIIKAESSFIELEKK